jgi:hypothetical protein
MIPQTDDPQLSLYLNIGYGKHFPIIPRILSPGIYIEGGLGADWVYLFSLFSEENTSKKDEDDYEFGYNAGVNFGFRLYTLIELGIADINMFVGYNFSLLIINANQDEYDFIHSPIIGGSITFNIGRSSGEPMGVGLEYAYYFPAKSSNRIAFHHFALVFRFKSNWNYW